MSPILWSSVRRRVASEYQPTPIVVQLQDISFVQFDAGALAAWLRQGEIEAAAVSCSEWNPETFRSVLPEIRALTREKNPAKFLPELRTLCASAGVALVVVRCPTGCRTSGAVRLLSSNKALLLLSFRYLVDDQFWFSFFHEAGHLILHSDRGVVWDDPDTADSPEEREANEFAADALIPSESQVAFSKLRVDSREIIRFAHKLGVAPGIVVGQLQYRGRISHKQLNSLKRRFEWKSS